MKALILLFLLLPLMGQTQITPQEYWINECIIYTDGTIYARDTFEHQTKIILTQLPDYQSFDLVKLQIKAKVEEYSDVDFVAYWEERANPDGYMAVASVVVAGSLVHIYYMINLGIPSLGYAYE